MRGYIYETNFLVDLGCSVMYKVLILSKPKWAHLNYTLECTM